MVPTAHSIEKTTRPNSGALVGAPGSSRALQAAERRNGTRTGTTDRDFGAPLMVVIPSGRCSSLYGARPEARLTMRTPEQIPTDQHLRAHARAADVARLPRAAVDVDLAAVVVGPGRATHRLGEVLWPDGVDRPGLDALGHQHDQVVPHRPPLPHAQRPSRAQGVHALP